MVLEGQSTMDERMRVPPFYIPIKSNPIYRIQKAKPIKYIGMK